jgi:WD40 repeat protein
MLSRWRYAPDFQWVEGVQTNQKEIKRIAVSPDGECFAIVAPHLWGVEVRRVDGLAVKRHLSEKSLTEYYALCFSDDGARLLVDCFSDDYGVAQFDVETGACHFHYYDDYLDFEYGKWSPDGKWFAYVTIFEDDDFSADGLYVRPVGEHTPDHEKFYELPPRRNIEFLWDLHWNPDSKRVVYYAELFNFETKCREGHLIACSLVENRVLWDVHVTLEKKINPVKVPRTTRVLSLGREVVCFTLDGRLIFFDAEKGNGSGKCG